MRTYSHIIITALFVMATIAITANVNAATTPELIVKQEDTTAHTVTLEWSESNDLFFSSYIVKYREAGTLDWTTVETISNKGTTSYRVADLEASTTYEFKVVDKDTLGTAESNVVQATTLEAPSTEGKVILEKWHVALMVFGCFIAGVVAHAWYGGRFS